MRKKPILKKEENLKIEASHFNDYAREVEIADIDISASFNPKFRDGDFLLKHLPKDLKNKIVLDLGCGCGAISVYLAKAGARVTGIDISPNMIKTASNLAKSHNVSRNTTFKVGNVEKLDFPDNFFDLAVGKAILHHIDMKQVLPELDRVLKPGAVVLFSEPLAYNPLALFYDKFATGSLRSEGERRITLKELKIINEKFRDVKWRGINIFSILLFLIDFIYLKITRPKIPLNWFERIEYGQTLPLICLAFDRLDRLIPKPFQLLGWKIIIAGKKA